MKQLNDKIITWLKEKGIDKLSPNKQYLKIIEEVGELARGLLKNDLEAIKDAIGDIYVAVVGLSLQIKLELDDDSCNEKHNDYERMRNIAWELARFNYEAHELSQIISELKSIAINNNLTLKECVSHAYNEIKDREIKIKNGVAVKND